MRINKSSRYFNITIFFFNIIIGILSFFIEDRIKLNINDYLFVAALSISFLLIIHWKNKLYGPLILFYDFNLIISLFIYNIIVSIFILLLSYIILCIFTKKNHVRGYFSADNHLLKNYCMIALSLFFTKGAYLILSHNIDGKPLLFVKVLIINLFYHLFFYIFTSIDYLTESTLLKKNNMLDNIITALVNFVYSTMLIYLTLTFNTLLGQLPLTIMLLLNTSLAFYYINSQKLEYEKNCIVNLQDAIKNSLSSKYDVFQKCYIYLNAINEILPCSLLSTYLIFDNQKKIMPIIYKCNESLTLKELSFKTENINDFNKLIDSSHTSWIAGEKLSNYFAFINKLNLGESNFVVVPLYINTKILGFTLLYPKYNTYNTNTFKYIANSQDCLSLMLESYYNLINKYPIWITTYDEFNSCIKDFINNKLSFTVHKLEVVNRHLQINFLDNNLQYLIVNHLNSLDKIFFDSTNTIYVVHALEYSLNANIIIESIEKEVCNYKNINLIGNEFKTTVVEYPTDYNTFYEIMNKLK